jgi:AraC family transcriptional activator of pobA
MKSAIPSYDLYGDQQQGGWTNSFQFEWIPVRSSPYNYDIRPHKHDAFIQILYLTQGGGDVLINDARYQVSSPALILIPSQNVHGFQFTPTIDGPVVTAAQKSLESMAAVVMPELVSVLRKPVVLDLAESSRHAEALMPLFLGIEREWRVHAVGQVAAGMSLVMALLVQVARLSNVLEPAPMANNSRKAQQIEKFRALVDAHFRDRRPIEDYANEMGLTAGHLTRLCREVLNVSSQDVVNARILHEAQRELVYSSDGIKQIAHWVGFVDEAYFTRFFRKHMGLTPSEFREQALRAMNGAAA